MTHPDPPKPPWLRKRLPQGPEYERIRSLITDRSLHTVCREAQCPNQWECYSRGTATFLILGDRCTRNCGFCAVTHGPPSPPDPDEPRRVAQAVGGMGLRYAVITSVTRDDLADGGAGCFAETIRMIRRESPGARVEVLIPDFQGDPRSLDRVLEARPDVLNHNLETVPRLYAAVRPRAVYGRSLDLLRRVQETAPEIPSKSGLMLGLGETDPEVAQTLADLREAGCRILTLGQYLRPTPAHLPVARYVTPEAFDRWREKALDMGFSGAVCGPFVRSSYHAEEVFERIDR